MEVCCDGWVSCCGCCSNSAYLRCASCSANSSAALMTVEWEGLRLRRDKNTAPVSAVDGAGICQCLFQDHGSCGPSPSPNYSTALMDLLGCHRTLCRGVPLRQGRILRHASESRVSGCCHRGSIPPQLIVCDVSSITGLSVSWPVFSVWPFSPVWVLLSSTHTR